MTKNTLNYKQFIISLFADLNVVEHKYSGKTRTFYITIKPLKWTFRRTLNDKITLATKHGAKVILNNKNGRI